MLCAYDTLSSILGISLRQHSHQIIYQLFFLDDLRDGDRLKWIKTSGTSVCNIIHLMLRIHMACVGHHHSTVSVMQAKRDQK